MSIEETRVLKERAEQFLDNARHLMSKGIYDIAAFNIEQFAPLYVKCELLLRTGTYPRTHSIRTLLRNLSLATSASRLEAFVDENLDLITKLEDIYVISRYLPRRLEKKEVENLLKLAAKMKAEVDATR